MEALPRACNAEQPFLIMTDHVVFSRARNSHRQLENCQRERARCRRSRENPNDVDPVQNTQTNEAN